MIRKKILIVGMLDSIHLYRWLSQFQDLPIDFLIFPSKKHKRIHAGTKQLLQAKSEANYSLATYKFTRRFHGYMDYLVFSVISRFVKLNLRTLFLKRVMSRHTFTFVHALEIQGAGYLIDEAARRLGHSQRLILTNWGSDIYFYQDQPEHQQRIRSALESADYYSAECHRDYELARKFGFQGVELPCIPNAGGFIIMDQFDSSKASERKNVAAKAYGGQFGRGDIVIESIRLAFNAVPHFTAFLYSVTDDLLKEVIDLTQQFPGRVEFSSRKNPLSQSEMNELFKRSRTYLGASKSDGISTSFLEALNFGCYPIQTDTSCAGDWEKLGAVASIVPQNVSIVADELIRSLTDNELVDSAQIQNVGVSKQYLSFEKVRSIATTFYN
jgi:hypothetical protein